MRLVFLLPGGLIQVCPRMHRLTPTWVFRAVFNPDRLGHSKLQIVQRWETQLQGLKRNTFKWKLSYPLAATKEGILQFCSPIQNCLATWWKSGGHGGILQEDQQVSSLLCQLFSWGLHVGPHDLSWRSGNSNSSPCLSSPLLHLSPTPESLPPTQNCHLTGEWWTHPLPVSGAPSGALLIAVAQALEALYGAIGDTRMVRVYHPCWAQEDRALNIHFLGSYQQH